MKRKIIVFIIISFFLVSIASADDWPIYHHDSQHTGYSPDIISRVLSLKWNITINGGDFLASPVIKDGVIFIGARTGKVYAINLSTGVIIWEYTTDGDVRSNSVAHGIVYATSWNGKLYALNLSTGAHIWNYSTGGAIADSGATVYNGIVYFGSYDRHLYALDESTGTQIWNYTVGDIIESYPAAASGMIYFGSNDNKLYALNATTGAHIWNYTTFGEVATPSISNGMILFGTYTPDGHIYALNQTTGVHIWNYSIGNAVWPSPAIYNGMVFTGSHNYKVYAFNQSTGTLIWNYTTNGRIYTSIAVSRDVLVFGSATTNDYNIYFVDPRNGSLIWNYTTGNWVQASPAIADNTIVVASRGDKIYAFWNATSPSVTLVSPVNNSVYSTNTITFIYTPNNNSVKISSCSIYGNFTGNFQSIQTNTNIIAGIQNNFTLSNLSTGSYIWNVKCINEYGNSAFASSNWIVNVTIHLDSDSDGVPDSQDNCSETPFGEFVDQYGCSCSQKTCDDGNECTDDICVNVTAYCQFTIDNSNTCGLFRDCLADHCDVNPPYWNWFDYPEDNHDYCSSGQCVQYQCTPDIYYRAECDQMLFRVRELENRTLVLEKKISDTQANMSLMQKTINQIQETLDNFVDQVTKYLFYLPKGLRENMVCGALAESNLTNSTGFGLYCEVNSKGACNCIKI